MILLGELALWVALMMAAWSAITSFVGGRTQRPDLILSGERGLQVAGLLTLAACAGLWTALLTHDFSLRYVAALTSANLPARYSFAAFWSARAGALLLTVLVLSACAAVLVRAWRDDRVLKSYFCGTVATFALLALASVCFVDNPYYRLDFVPPDGMGMQPRLQEDAAALHVPMVQSGYAAALLVIALVAAIGSRRVELHQRLPLVRRWTAVAWCFLTIGVLLSMLATYRELGRPAWIWNPLENLPLSAWVAATAVLGWLVARESSTTRKGSSWKVGTGLALAGVVAVAAGLLGVTTLSRDHDVRLKAGETFTQADPLGREWSVASQGASRLQGANYKVAAIALQLSRNGDPIGLISSEERQYVDSRETTTYDPFIKSGIRAGLMQDIVVRLAHITTDEAATLRISFRPLTSWIWIGGAMLAIGGMLMAWPSSREQTT